MLMSSSVSDLYPTDLISLQTSQDIHKSVRNIGTLDKHRPAWVDSFKSTVEPGNNQVFMLAQIPLYSILGGITVDQIAYKHLLIDLVDPEDTASADRLVQELTLALGSDLSVTLGY